MATNKQTDIPADGAADGLALTEAERAEARKEGAKKDVQDAAAESHRFLTDGQLPGGAVGTQYTGWDDITMYAPALDLAPDAFKERIKANADSPLPEEKVYGLLHLERNGKNRTPYVRALMQRLKIKADDLPPGSQPYTNDMTAITDL